MQSEKVWFITGASRGFGYLWAEAALKRGDKVAATARNTKALEDLVTGYGGHVLPLQLDLTDEKNVTAAIEQAHQHFGRLDIVLSNAGYGVMGAVEEASLDEARAAFETNVLGAQSVVKAAVPLLRTQQSGHILAVSSMAGLRPFPLGGVYVATKFALEGMMETLAQEVAGFGIKVTLIEPGPFATEFMSASSMKQTKTIPVYDPIRQALMAHFTPDAFEDPRKTIAALFKIVDAPEPPLHVMFGAHLETLKQVYAARMEDWEQWAWEKIAGTV